MKNKLYIFLAALIIGLALFLRLYKIENRAPFDWDQNRDYVAISGIASGKATLIGPVAKGEGGFFLGPLYYYLATPAYLLMDGSPLALPLTSVVIDVLAIVAVLGLFRKIIGDHKSLALATIWSCSWFAIEMSRISWNVALVPIWSVLLLWFLTQKQTLSMVKVGLLGLLVGLSWHIHAALIPISLAVLLFTWKTWVLGWKHLVAVIIGYSIPLIPLLLFDLRHSGLNFHLLTQMFEGSTLVTASFPKLLEAIMLRLGKNSQSLLLGISSYHLVLGYVVSITSLLALLFSRGIFRLSGLIIMLNILAIFALKVIGFPEYYFAASYIPTLILFIGTISYFTKNNKVILILIILFLVFQNTQKYSFEETPFALSRKVSVAKLMRSLDTPIDMHTIMAPGREGGIKAFYKLYGGKLDGSSPLKVVVTDQSEGPIIEGGELTTIIGNFGGIRVAKIVVE